MVGLSLHFSVGLGILSDSIELLNSATKDISS